jgi:hypothetical protein
LTEGPLAVTPWPRRISLLFLQGEVRRFLFVGMGPRRWGGTGRILSAPDLCYEIVIIPSGYGPGRAGLMDVCARTC